MEALISDRTWQCVPKFIAPLCLIRIIHCVTNERVWHLEKHDKKQTNREKLFKTFNKCDFSLVWLSVKHASLVYPSCCLRFCESLLLNNFCHISCTNSLPQHSDWDVAFSVHLRKGLWKREGTLYEEGGEKKKKKNLGKCKWALVDSQCQGDVIYVWMSALGSGWHSLWAALFGFILLSPPCPCWVLALRPGSALCPVEGERGLLCSH